MKQVLTFISLILLATGCSTDSDSLQSILGQENTHFRGNSIGDKFKKVLKETEDDHVVSNTENGINCEIQVAETEMLVRYEFDQEELYSIQADIFFSDSTELMQFQEELVSLYNDNYGEVNENGGFLVWKARANSGAEVQFAVADESIEFGRPKLSLTIYNFGY
ncbi:MAG: hypothetical protein QF371_00910 [Flavobacteriales bacterium]|jgi:hypothetical protein|nr:hypothetical protein [Flavobacteriales bacterium]